MQHPRTFLLFNFRHIISGFVIDSGWRWRPPIFGQIQIMLQLGVYIIYILYIYTIYIYDNLCTYIRYTVNRIAECSRLNWVCLNMGEAQAAKIYGKIMTLYLLESQPPYLARLPCCH